MNIIVCNTTMCFLNFNHLNIIKQVPLVYKIFNLCKPSTTILNHLILTFEKPKVISNRTNHLQN